MTTKISVQIPETSDNVIPIIQQRQLPDSSWSVNSLDQIITTTVPDLLPFTRCVC